MTEYHVDYTDKAIKQLQKMDKHTQKLIYSWIGKHLEGCADPRVHGKGLSADRTGQWRYRIGDYRIIADIQDERLLILVIAAGHRREIYS